METTGLPDKTQSHVTLVISHRVPKRSWKEFAILEDELAKRLKSFEGFLGMESSSPKKDQEEWVRICRFLNSETLEKWMKSPERLRFIKAVRELTGSEGNLQVLVEPRNNESVTTVFAHRIHKGREEDYRKWRIRILEAQRNFKGFLGVESFDPIEGVSDQWVDVGHFVDSESRVAWLESKERKQLLAELGPIASDVSVKPVSSGLDAWFRSRGSHPSEKSPPAWKQALSVLFALYPLVMALTYYFNPLLGSTSLPVVMLIANAASVALLTWLVMNAVNRLLGFWLQPKKQSLRLDIVGALIILVALILMVLLFEQLTPLK